MFQFIKPIIFYVSVFMDTIELRCVSLNKIITKEN